MLNNPLTQASELIEKFGINAELVAGGHMEDALQADNLESFEEWRLVAKAVALLTRTPSAEGEQPSESNIPPVTTSADLKVFEPRRARR